MSFETFAPGTKPWHVFGSNSKEATCSFLAPVTVVRETWGWASHLWSTRYEPVKSSRCRGLSQSIPTRVFVNGHRVIV